MKTDRQRQYERSSVNNMPSIIHANITYYRYKSVIA